ncbi:glycosyltransferase family 2 protein [Pseudomonas typographi]|uniref:Glycosyltransferase family 2 protein n=1 Tax=Pseudomonas typographi TaxID=2715964 RepID=A0ABR7Z9L5_9PSED|nr:glycosyltransferase family 2 protein [Pseudomonas typographi]MBD1553269.1 glycosyltransferase family 2 protein [Pseudomonas typographi]MBD1602016.1 glycosyltransferase family 2 protein [Pseudomonas typographi]
MKFSLVIPCYNEAKNIPLLLERCTLLVQNPKFEVIIVDNGSTDESSALLSRLLATSPQFRFIRVPVNKGYGFGILAGLSIAHGDVIGWTHADLQADPCDVLKAAELYELHGSEIFVKGKRFGRPFADQLFTLGMSLFETVLLRRRLWDINAQPTLFPRTFFLSWENPPHDFSLDLFAYYHSKTAKLTTHRFRVRFGSRVHGVSHWNVNWRAKLKFIRRTIGYSLQLRKRVKL